MAQVRPYGSWSSPISADMVVASAVSIGEVRATATAVYWSELRPDDGGRVQIVRQVLETDTGSIGDESRAAIAADVAGQPVRDGPAALRVA
ncbi:MAG: hypothetical protein JJLCMIEE_02929 [Acidimicrobiales bacterium]|nr:hypothetical protein [Acidimicrobiales bacterium]